MALVGWVGCGGEQQRLLPGLGDPKRGQELLAVTGCGTCHHIPAVAGASGTIGPPLDRWRARRYIAGKMLNSPDALVAWIMDPQRIDPGNAMPSLDVGADDARDMAAYLYTLR